jgi:hypothetical protein
LLVVIPGAGLFLVGALGFGISSILSLVSNGIDPVGAMIGAFSAGVEGLILAVAAWFVLQKTLGHPKAEIFVKLPFSNLHILFALAIIGLALLVGGLVSLSGIKWLGLLILPVFTILVITPPIWVLLGLGTNGIEFGPRWRTWSIFGIGMTLGPLVMLTLEFILVLVLAVGASVYIATNPQLVEEIINLVSVIGDETRPEVILELLAPYIVNRGVITLTLLFFALAIPMIEELFKPLGIWLFAAKIQSPAQGFALGLLSGAAYALVESLGVSAQGDNSWPLVVSVRAGTSLLHIITTGLMGWAIVKAWQERKIFNLIVTYTAAVLIHGIWNGSVVGIGIAAVSDMVNETNFAVSYLPATVCGISTLVIGMLAILLASNRRVKKLSLQKTNESGIDPENIPPEEAEGVK